MASGRVLKLKFGTMNGEKTWTLKNVQEEVAPAKVKTLMDTMVTNGSIYKYPPLTKVSATLVTTTEEEYPVND